MWVHRPAEHDAAGQTGQQDSRLVVHNSTSKVDQRLDADTVADQFVARVHFRFVLNDTHGTSTWSRVRATASSDENHQENTDAY